MFKKSKLSSSFRRKKETTFFKSILTPILSGLMIFAVIGFLVITNFERNKKRSELNLRIENLKNEIEILERKKQELSAGISQISTEEYLEKEAREKFNLKKPGEELVVILSSEESEEEVPEKKEGFWQRFLEKIGF
ncbi:septum formation initiator family protein [Patescibacteria group bacterium]|nr:septum formation initiator family protein [Patescibacteria group bacterium]